MRRVNHCYSLKTLNILVNQISLKQESKAINVLKQVSRQTDTCNLFVVTKNQWDLNEHRSN